MSECENCATVQAERDEEGAEFAAMLARQRDEANRRAKSAEAEREEEEDRANENATLVHEARAERDDLRAALDRVEALDFAAVLAEHPPTYTQHANDPTTTFHCAPCSEAKGDWVTWTPAHVADALRAAVEGDRS